MTTPEPTGLADGDWHRLHPATPLFRGGIVFVAIVGWILVNLRDVFFESLFDEVVPGDGPREPNPARDWILANVPIAMGVLLVVLLVVVAFAWLSWRMHEFRVTDELVEVRSGVIWRRHRRGRLDRIQGVNIVRPIVPRIFGAARLEISVAGEDANIRLAYLAGWIADALRADILRRATEARSARIALAVEERLGSPPSPLLAERPAAAGPGFLEQRAAEFLRPELDQPLAAPDSLVRMDVGRLVASTALSLGIPTILVAAAIWVGVATTREFAILFVLVPSVIALATYAVRRVTRSLRYSIAATPDGIRVGFGLLSTTNETLPPGRIHAVQVSQPLVWRPFGWWTVRLNRAANSSRDGAAGQANTTILPVGDLADVEKVLGLVLPDDAALVREALVGRGGDGFTVSPPRARPYRWFSRRRNGFRLASESVVLRKGAIWREAIFVPLARVQSVAIVRGPLARAARLARVEVHTVAGVITPSIGAIDEHDARSLFSSAESRVIEAMAA